MVTLTAPRALVAAVQADPSGLVVIDSAGHRLRADAAASVVRMRAAGCPAEPVTSAWRSSADQADQVRRQAAGLTPSAAAVGTSWHEAGLAVDWPQPARAWVAAHGSAYGWIRTIPTIEPWHAVYVPAQDQHAGRTPTSTTSTTTSTEDDMSAEDTQRIIDIANAVGRLERAWGSGARSDGSGRDYVVDLTADRTAAILAVVQGLAAGRDVDVDEGAIAAALAPLVVAQVASLSDADVSRLARAVADEQARRLAS